MATPTVHLLTTVDNPFNPHSHFEEWDAWDRRSGYNTLALFARVCRTSEDLSEADQDQAESDAIDEIVRENVSGVHAKVDSHFKLTL